MNELRRKILNQGGFVAAIAAIGFPFTALSEWPEKAFTANSMEDALNALIGTTESAEGDIVIKAPTIAENGAVVPITVTSNIQGTESISVVVIENPQPLIASFDLIDSAPYVSTRIKMAKTSNVVAIVSADGKFYNSTAEIKVTIGGCGG
ncbi:MAG: thiosulfate oxidation carrier protein SoxY [Gammaproteobacteria bacterium]|nr:thiosulfate oxidation carrier protein SoxY [Gammaproteobacteria bacterium]